MRVQFGRQPRLVIEQVSGIRLAAYLNAAHSAEHSDLIAKRAQIFERVFPPAPRPVAAASASRERLKGDVVFEQKARNMTVLAAVLAQHRVFKLDGIDTFLVDDSMQLPFHVGVME